MSRNDRATYDVVAAAVKNLEVANEYHRRAEMQRRAMMTPQQRAAVDHALEIEAVHEAGQKDANLRAFTVVLAGVVAAYALGASIAGWVAGPVLVATAVVAVQLYRARRRVLAAQLADLVGHTD